MSSDSEMDGQLKLVWSVIRQSPPASSVPYIKEVAMFPIAGRTNLNVGYCRSLKIAEVV